MVDIRNRQELEKWLDGREREDVIVIAARVALRVLPRSARIFETGFEGPRENFTIRVFRAIANARVAAVGPTREFEVAATAATAATANATYYAAAYYAAAAATAPTTIWEAVSADATSLKNGTTSTTLAAAPLWPGDAPEWVTEDWAIMVNALNKVPDEDWGVWIDWYEARLRGDPPNEPLERARVLEITEEM